jgi:hypothetical protein
MLKYFVILTLLLVFSLCCGVKQEQMSTTPPPDQIAFEVIDGLSNGFEGMDKVQIKTTKGVLSAANIYLSTNGGTPPFDIHPLLPSGNGGLFEVELLCSPYELRWFIAAEGLGVTTEAGSVSAPFVTQKYLNKENADAMIRDQMNNLLSGSKFATFFPKTVGNTYLYTHPLDNSIQVPFDHYIDNFQIDNQHARYGIEYSTSIYSGNGLPVLNKETPRYELLKQNISQDLGYVIINTTDTNGMKKILQNSGFFPPTPATVLESVFY